MEPTVRNLFPIDALNKIAFPTDKQADVLSDANSTNTINEQNTATNSDKSKESPDDETQELTSGGGDFSQDLTNFLKKKKDEPERIEKIEKAEALGMIETQKQPEQ